MELYHKDTSPAARAVYAVIKHLNLSVSLKYVNSIEGTRTPEFIKLNPAHQIPILIDNEFVLTESRAIMCYLVNQYSPNASIYPEDPKSRANIDRMLYFDGTNFFPALKAALIPRIRKKQMPTEEQMQDVRNSIAELLKLKGSNKFLAGKEPSLADISVAMSYELLKIAFPEEAQKLNVWYKAVEDALPAVKEINDSVDFCPLVEMLKI